MSGNPVRTVESYSHRFNTSALGLGPASEIFLEVERSTGPSIADTLHVFTVEQARTLAENLLQSIEDTEPKEGAATPDVHYPTPPADLAQHLHGLPYGEEFTT